MDQAPAAPAAEVPAPGATPAAAPVEAQKPERTFSQTELDDILKKKDAKRLRERDELRKENEVLRKLALERAAAREQKEETPAKPQPTGEPTREQFGTYEEFIEARAEWKADQKVSQKFKEREEADRKLSAEESAKKAGEEFRKRAKETAKDIPDFDQVMGEIKADDPVARIAADPIANSDRPAELLYHLAKNPDEAERIASLPLGQQAREIWKLEQKLSAKAPVKPSQAPEPIKPVGGKAAAVGNEEPDAAKDPKGWLKWRNEQLAARRRTGVRA